MIRYILSSVLPTGLDGESPEGGFRRAMPVEKALGPHTLLARSVDGEALPEDHGFPLRAAAPGERRLAAVPTP